MNRQPHRIVRDSATATQTLTDFCDPSALGCNLDGQPSFDVDSSNEILHIDDLGLELDHEERAARRMEGEDVDDPALPVDGERNFWPSRRLSR